MIEESIYIGHVSKVHGLQGTFSIKLEGSVDFCKLCLKIKKIHTRLPFQLLTIENLKLESQIFLKTKLNEIRDRESAKSLLQTKIYIKKGHVLEIDTLIKEQNKLIGYEVIVDKKCVGIVDSIEHDRPQPIMIIKKENKKIMAPYVNEFILKTDHKNKKLIVDFPEGLIDICLF